MLFQEGGPVGMAAVVAHFKELNGDNDWEVDQVLCLAGTLPKFDLANYCAIH